MTMTPKQSGQGPTHNVGPAQTQSDKSFKSHTLPLTLTFLGTIVILGTYLAVILTQPANLGTDLGHTTLWVMLGYLAGGVLLAAGTLPLIPRSILALIPVAIAANIVIGQVVGTITPIPLYLDSIGTVMIGVLAGPAAGAFTGIISNLIWGVTLSPSVIAFSSGAAFIGAAAG
ncbi:MAG: histidine kinase, partial [Brevibacterium aurantiacum]|nr:histidine kinase [Brevibacterium aurantiacum]